MYKETKDKLILFDAITRNMQASSKHFRTYVSTFISIALYYIYISYFLPCLINRILVHVWWATTHFSRIFDRRKKDITKYTILLMKPPLLRLERLGSQIVIHHIYPKSVLSIVNKIILVFWLLNLNIVSLSLYRALILKEINIVYKNGHNYPAFLIFQYQYIVNQQCH